MEWHSPMYFWGNSLMWRALNLSLIHICDLFGRLLAEIQRIKSTGDYAGAHDLVEAYAVKVDPEMCIRDSLYAAAQL